MKRVVSVLCLSTGMLAGCGSAPPAPEVPATAPTAAASAAPSAAPTAGSPRATDAAKWLKDMEGPDVDVTQRGRLATNGLSEAEFELPADLRKAMAAVTSDAVDPSQTAMILASTFTLAPMADVLAKQCGKPIADVLAAVKSAKAEEKSGLVVKQCKLEGLVAGAELPKLNYTAVLLSAVLQKLLLADPKHTDAEIGMAKLTANLARLDSK